MLPTFIAFDAAEFANSGVAVRFNPINARGLDSITAKILSFASYELPRFIAGNHKARMAWLMSDWRVAPFAFLTVGVGLLQPIAMLFLWFRRREGTFY